MEHKLREMCEISRLAGDLVDKLSLVEYCVLDHLEGYQGTDIVMREISDYMGFTSSAGSQILKKLANNKLVEFYKSELYDTRSTAVRITDKGIERLNKVLDPAVKTYFQQRKVTIDSFNKDIDTILKKLKGVRNGSKK